MDKTQPLSRPSLLVLLSISLSTICCLPTGPSVAQTPSVPQPSLAPLNLSLLQSRTSPANNSATAAYTINCDKATAIAANTICQRGLTIPSLWWADEQFGGKLLDNWLAYPGDGTTPGHIDLVVNRQIWSLLDYLERYNFVNKFGEVAGNYGYNVRVFNYQAERLATYTCNFSTTPRQCKIDLNVTGKAVVRGSSTNPQR